MLVDFIKGTPYLIILAGVAYFLIRRFDRKEQRWLWYAFWAHVASSVAQILITRLVYGQGDMLGFFYRGTMIADLMRGDVVYWFRRVMQLIAGYDVLFPVTSFAGTSTGSLTGISVFLVTFTFESLFASCLIVSFAAFVGKALIYEVYRIHFPKRYRVRMLVAIMLTPSVVFWTSGLLKETVAMFGLGVAVYGLQMIILGKSRLKAGLIFTCGAYLVSLVKTYILFPLLIAGGVWFYWARSKKVGGTTPALKPFYLVIAVALAMGGVVLLGNLFPKYSFENVATEAAYLQQFGETREGGSTYQMGDSTERSLTGQLAFAPVALITSLFRPFIFEVHNVLSLINALEATVITLMFVMALWSRRLIGVHGVVSSSPILMFSLTFVVLFGVAVGLASTNLGTLSRYRVPMMPFWVVLLALLVPLRRHKPAAPANLRAVQVPED